VLFSAAVWWTHRERLKLDLYKRRFDIYSRTLDLYHAFSDWTPSETEKNSMSLKNPSELRKAQQAFIKASREAQFLFDDPELQKHIAQIRDDFFHLIIYRRDIAPRLKDPKEIAENYEKLFIEPLHRIENSLNPDSSNSLEEKMSRYLVYKRRRFSVLPR